MFVCIFSCSEDEEKEFVKITDAYLTVEEIGTEYGYLYVSANVTGNPEQVWAKIFYPSLGYSIKYQLFQAETNRFHRHISINRNNFPDGIIGCEITVAKITYLTNEVYLEWQTLVSNIQLNISDRVILANNSSCSTLEIKVFDNNQNELSNIEYQIYDNDEQIYIQNNQFKTNISGFHNLYVKFENVISNEKVVDAINPNYEFEIPVIFHIVNLGEPIGNGTNLTQSKVHNLLTQLNNGFSNSFGSTNPYAKDMGIVFRLAQLDQNNIPLSEIGINRINGNSYDDGSPQFPNSVDIASDGKLGPNEIWKLAGDHYWNPRKYLNILIFPGQYSESYSDTGYVFESYPLNGIPTRPDDCDCNPDSDFFQMCFIHSNGTSVDYKTLIHEVGHAFSLLHVFSTDNCNSSDYCPDTYSYDRNTSDWSPCPDNLTGELHDNYMDYSGVRNTFSKNQRERIRHVMKYGIWLSELKYSTK